MSNPALEDRSSISSTRTKFKIEQKVHTEAVRKGPYAVQRSVDPNEVVIKRRFGEGALPLFQRDDIAVNSGTETDKISGKSSGKKRPSNHSRSRSPRVSRSPDRVHQRQTYLHTRSSYNTRSNSKARPASRSPRRYPPLAKSSKGSKPPISTEKVPYFLDEKREKDRLHRLYGASDKAASTSMAGRKSSRQRTKSRSRTPPRTRSKSKAFYNSRRRSCSRDKPKVDSDVPRNTCKCESAKRDSTRVFSSSTSDIYSHSRSRRYDCNDPHQEEYTGAKPYQYIPIPVPVPADPYLYTAWASQQGGWAAHTGPPPRFSPYAPMPMPPGPPMMPSMRLPSPYVMPPYNPHMFRPPPHTQRYGSSNYAPRFSKGNYRP